MDTLTELQAGDVAPAFAALKDVIRKVSVAGHVKGVLETL